MKVQQRSESYMKEHYGDTTLAHASPSGLIEVGPKASKEDVAHEKAHFQIGFTGDMSEASSYKRYLKEELAAWLVASENLGRLDTEFVWRVASNALDYKGATPKKVVSEVTRYLKDTKYRLNKRERAWLLKMLRAVE